MHQPDSSTSWTVRPYETRDRSALRALAVDTAECGSPSPGLFNDRDLLGDILTDYYLEREADSCLVAEEKGRLVGYLLGCPDTVRCSKTMAFAAPKIFWRAAKRGLFFRRTAWKILARAAGTVWRIRPYKNRDIVRRYPAHLHVNLAASHRGRGVGRTLVETFLARARGIGIPGVHLGARADNPSRAFFERMGFRAAGRGRFPSWSAEGAATIDVALYVKELG